MNFRETLKINKNNHLEIGGVDCETLINNYGTPLYVMDVSHIEKMCKTFINALNKEGISGTVSYASKAFCCKEMLRLIKKLDMSCDVVSGGELYTAIKAGFNPEKIYFHGNNKTKKELSEAIKYGVGTIVIDGLNEIDSVNEIASNSGIKQNVLIRVNPGIEAHTHHYIQTATPDSKFGFSIDNGDADVAVKKVLSMKNLILSGLHCHIGSQIFEKKSYVIAIQKMMTYFNKIRNELKYELKVLDIGGGFGIWYNDDDVKMTYSDYEDFINEIAKTIKSSLGDNGGKLPYLILEPGRSIVGEAGITLYSVGEIKEITGIKNYIAVDGGMFENPRFALYQARYTACAPLKMDLELNNRYTVCGKCCESGDILIENALLPEMKTGDALAVFSTGAYNYSMASNYNRNLIPPVVFVKDGKSKYAVKPQSYRDLIKNDV